MRCNRFTLALVLLALDPPLPLHLFGRVHRVEENKSTVHIHIHPFNYYHPICQPIALVDLLLFVLSTTATTTTMKALPCSLKKKQTNQRRDRHQRLQNYYKCVLTQKRLCYNAKNKRIRIFGGCDECGRVTA